MSVKELLEKGDGVLVRTLGVWTYPGAPLDPSGTNLKLPVEYVTDAEVKDGLAGDDIVVATVHADGSPLSVRIKSDGAHRVLSSAQVGTAEAGTELPVGSRPSVDAGKAASVIEGAEKPGKEAKSSAKEPTSETDARKGR